MSTGKKDPVLLRAIAELRGKKGTDSSFIKKSRRKCLKNARKNFFSHRRMRTGTDERWKRSACLRHAQSVER